MNLDEQLMQKENKLTELRNRICYIDGNIDQLRFQNSPIDCRLQSKSKEMECFQITFVLKPCGVE